MLLGETKLCPNQSLWLRNFFVYYRRDEISPEVSHLPGETWHGARGRGVAYVRKYTQHSYMPPGRAICKFAASYPPGTPFVSGDIRKILNEYFCHYSGRLKRQTPPWRSRVMNPASRGLFGSAEEACYKVPGPDVPTHKPSSESHAPDVLDIVLCRKIPCPVQVEVLYDADANHLAVLIVLSGCGLASSQRSQISNRLGGLFKSSLYLQL